MGTPARMLASAAVVVLAAGVGVAGLIWAAPDGPHRDGGGAAVAAPRRRWPWRKPPPSAGRADAARRRPRLQADPAGACRRRGRPGQGDRQVLAGGRPRDSGAATSSGAEPTSGASSSATKPGAVDGPPAGPAGDLGRPRLRQRLRPSTRPAAATPAVRQAFGATATPALAKALLQRPPRLPANVKVPKAKVVNVVAGALARRRLPGQRLAAAGRRHQRAAARHGKAAKASGWRVTNVLG